MSRTLLVIMIYEEDKILKYKVLDPIKLSTYCNYVKLDYVSMSQKKDLFDARFSDTTFYNFQ